MKSKEVLELLQITRPTLTKYVKEGTIKTTTLSNGYCVSKIFQDVASGISFEKRKEFFKMLDDIISGKVERVVITYKNRLKEC